MRAFVALRPPPEAVEDLEEFLAPRRGADPGLRWTPPEQWHITLAFLPDVAERHLDDLVERLGRAAGRRTAVDLAVHGGGAFPDVARGRVLVAGLDPGPAAAPAEELRRLATGVRAAAGKAGAAPDGGRFRPHVILARSGRPQDLTRWVRVLDAYAGPRWPAAQVELVASSLGQGPGGRPRHDVLERFDLRPAPLSG